MGRPPSNGGPSFRFNATEVAEMEAILQAHNTQMPSREMLVSLAEKFSTASDRSGKVVVQMKQVWNWFQNRRYALRAKASKTPVKLSVSPLTQNDLAAVRNVPQAPQHVSVPSGSAVVRNVPQVPQPISSASVQSAGRNGSDNSQMEFEAKSARDGAWYDVATFISHRSVESADPEVLVRLAGFGPEEDEWVNIRKHVRQRSLPCESSECVSVLPGDLILCFQEGKEQALYFDAHVLDAQRRRHDVRGCRCRFLVRYDHDQSEEIVPLRKVCRRPETDYRMQQLHAESANMNRNKTGSAPLTGNIIRVYTSPEAIQKLHKAEVPAETKEQPPKAEALAPVSHANASATTAAVPNAVAGITSAAQPLGPVAITTNPIAHSNVSEASIAAASTTTPAVQFNNFGATVSTVTATPAVAHSIASGTTASMTTQDAISHVSASATSAVTSTTTVANSTAAAANDSVVTTSSPTANFDVFGVTKSVDTTMTPENSDVSGVTNIVATATAPVANSNSSIAPTVDPIAADVVTPVAESKVFPENASEVGATSSAQNADPQLAEIKVSNSTSSDADTRGSSGENILQG